MAEVTPELLSQIKDYLDKREKGETQLLSFFYKEAFGREIKKDCGGCIEDSIGHLKQLLINKSKITMKNYKWVGSDKASVNMRIGDSLVNICKSNCTDVYAEKIAANPKYSHLVERIDSAEPEIVTPKLKKKEEEFKGEGLAATSPESAATISTSKGQKKDGKEVKSKGRKPKSK